jgi:hypothetical protein
MLTTTSQIVNTALQADPSVSTPERQRLLKLLREGPPKESTAIALEARLVRRAEAARRLSCSLRQVDLLSQQNILEKRFLPGRRRASGITSQSLEAAIRGFGQ